MKNILIEDAKLMFRNFGGKEGKFNPAGRRNFCVFLDNDVAKHLVEEGWNIKHLKPLDDETPPQAYLQVAVSFDNKPPKILLINSHGKTLVDEKNVDILDWADIRTADLAITPYQWEVNGKSGVKAYLKTLYATVEEDEFADKYADAPDSAAGTIGGCGNCDICDGGCSA